MAEKSVPAEGLSGKGEIVLFETGKTEEKLRDYLGIITGPLSNFLMLLDDVNDDRIHAVAVTGKSLLAHANHLLDQLDDHMSHAGIKISVGVLGPSWEPMGVKACSIRMDLQKARTAQGEQAWTTLAACLHIEAGRFFGACHPWWQVWNLGGVT